MKKVLSFVLVLAMILGCTSMAFAGVSVAKVTEDNTVVPFDDAKDNGMATILKDMGVLEGKGNNIVDLEGTLSRAEAATIVVRALGLDDLGKVPTQTEFVDVPLAWYSGYVAVAAAEGIVDGTDKVAKTFEPTRNISVDECLALIVKVLGYRAEHLNGVWPSNFRNVARKLGMLDGITVGTQAATREDLFTILFNALDKNKVEWVESSDGYYVGSNEGAEHYFANETLFQALTGLNKKLNQVYTWGAVRTLDASVEFDNGFDASEFIGKNVTLLEKANTTGTSWSVIGIYSVDSKEVEGKFGATTTTFTAIDKTAYALENGALKGATIYLNGGKKTTAEAFDLISGASVTAEVRYNVTGEKIAEVYSIEAWIGVDHFVTEADAKTLAKEPTAFGNYTFPTTKAAAGSNKNVVDYSEFELVGADTLADIKEDDVLTFYKEGGDGTVAKLVVTRNVVVGAVTRITSDGKYTVNGEVYEYADPKDSNATGANVPGAAEVKKGTEYAFYLNQDGDIFFSKPYKEAAAEVAWTYAYVLNKVIVPGKEVKSLDATTATTYYAIRLLPVGTDETVDFTTEAILTEKGIGYNVVSDAAVAGLVKYKLDSKGALSTIAAVTLTPSVGNTDSKTTVYAKKTIDGHPIADSVVVTTINSKVATGKAAHYVATDLADILGKTYEKAKIGYVVDAGKIILVQIGGVAVTDTTTYVISAAAFLDYDYDVDGTIAKFLIDGEEEEFYVSEGSFYAANLSRKDVYQLTLQKANDQISDVVTLSALQGTAAPYSYVYVATFAGLTVAGNAVTVSGKAVEADFAYATGNAVIADKFDSTQSYKLKNDEEVTITVDDEAVIYFFDYSEAAAPAVKQFEVLSSVVQAVEGANLDVTFIDIDGDMIYDVVVVR